jgi:hypothetical protein
MHTEITFLSHAIIPSAKDGVSIQKVRLLNKLSIAHSFSNKIGLGYSIGYDYLREIMNFTYSVAIGFSLGESFGAYIESYGVYAEQDFFESCFDTNLTYLTNYNFQLDLSYGLGLNNDR